MTRSTTAVVIAFMISSPVLAQNLLVNPGFDNPDQLDGWACTSTHGLAYWSPEDHLGSVGSGSVEHEVSAPADDQWVRCSQCVPAHQHWPYAGSVWHYWPDDPDVFQTGKIVITFGYYSDPNCTDSLPVGGGKNAGPVLDTWVQAVSSEVVAPAGAMSASFHIFTWQYNANEPVRARLDDVDFSPIIMFWDDFESGGTGAWTTTFP